MTDTILDDLRWAKQNRAGMRLEPMEAETVATHIDAQDAKIKALVEALEHLRGLDGYEHIGAWFDEIDAALAAAKETTT